MDFNYQNENVNRFSLLKFSVRLAKKKMFDDWPSFFKEN